MQNGKLLASQVVRDIRRFGDIDGWASNESFAYDIDSDEIQHIDRYASDEWKDITHPQFMDGPIVCVDCHFTSGVDRRLRFAAGEKVPPYFAHLPGEAPEGTHRHGETADHLNGKKMIYDWLSGNPMVESVNQEYWIPTKNRISDVQATLYNGLIVGFEIQRWDMTESEWADRHHDYVKAGVKDVWLWSTRVSRPQLINKSYNSVAFDSRLGKIGAIFLEPYGHLPTLQAIESRLIDSAHRWNSDELLESLSWFTDTTLSSHMESYPKLDSERSRWRIDMRDVDQWGLSDKGELIYPKDLKFLTGYSHPTYTRLRNRQQEIEVRIKRFKESKVELSRISDSSIAVAKSAEVAASEANKWRLRDEQERINVSKAKDNNVHAERSLVKTIEDLRS